MNKAIYTLFIIIMIISQCSFLVNKFAFFPDSTNNISKENLPENVEEIFFNTSDNEKLHSFFLKSDSSNKLLIYFHGNAGNISGRFMDLLEINKMGINVFGISYRGYGRSSGKPNEKGIYTDGISAYHHAINKLGYSPHNILILGRSIGSSVATSVTSKYETAGLILVTPISNGKEYAKCHGLGFISFLAGDSFNNLKRIEKITCPILIIHVDRDNTIPFFMGKALYDNAATDKKQLVIIPGGGHNNLSSTYGKLYWKAIERFLKPLQNSI